MSADRLKEFGLFAEFTDEDRECIGELLETQSVIEGRRIFSEATESEGLVLVVEGTIRVESRRNGSSESLDAPQALGALALTAVGPREATVIAETACTVLRLPRTAYRRLVEDQPRTACRLAEAILGEYSALLRGQLDRLADD